MSICHTNFEHLTINGFSQKDADFFYDKSLVLCSMIASTSLLSGHSTAVALADGVYSSIRSLVVVLLYSFINIMYWLPLYIAHSLHVLLSLSKYIDYNTDICSYWISLDLDFKFITDICYQTMHLLSNMFSVYMNPWFLCSIQLKPPFTQQLAYDYSIHPHSWTANIAHFTSTQFHYSLLNIKSTFPFSIYFISQKFIEIPIFSH